MTDETMTTRGVRSDERAAFSGTFRAGGVQCPACGFSRQDGTKCSECGRDLSALIAVNLLPESFSRLGTRALHDGDRERAVEALCAAVALAPQCTEFVLQLADVYLQMHLFVEANALLQRVEADDPANAEVRAKRDELRRLAAKNGFRVRMRSITVAVSAVVVTVLATATGSWMMYGGRHAVGPGASAQPVVDTGKSSPGPGNAADSRPASAGVVEKEVRVVDAPAAGDTRDGNFIDVVFPYRVRKGETLWTIACNVLGQGGSWKEIYSVNKDLLPSADRIDAGQTIMIPVKAKCSVKR